MLEAMEPMPDLDAPLPGCIFLTWRVKRELCFMEGRDYAQAGEPPESNPYLVGTWPWRWFNEAYLLNVELEMSDAIL